ncbi:MAG: class I tRNA ligase family protein, partial [Oscillospiraceae bacterium]|nr:class I tRNA ligase family protein [Oscillospiraceae bacterium]
ELRIFVTLLCPFAPHIAEEMWQNAGGQGLCSLTPWAQYDQSKTQDSVVEVAVQVSGKFRGTITLPAATSKDDALAAVRADSKFAQYLDGKAVVKEIFVPDKLVNIVVK